MIGMGKQEDLLLSFEMEKLLLRQSCHCVPWENEHGAVERPLAACEITQARSHLANLKKV